MPGIFRYFFLTVFSAAFFTCVFAQDSLYIAEQGRRIQLDGILLEWDASQAHIMKDKRIGWDAINTPDGIAGYFRIDRADSCVWTFRFFPRTSDFNRSHDLRLDTGAQDGSFYRVYKSKDASDSSIVAEWVIPWNDVDTAGYSVGIMAFNKCGDTLKPLILTGSHGEPASPFSTKVKIQMVVIAVLLVAFFTLKNWALRKRTRRKESPRQ